jgi:hypothetical protein
MLGVQQPNGWPSIFTLLPACALRSKIKMDPSVRWDDSLGVANFDMAADCRS